jgi:signal transduction histidine kinase
VCLYLAGGVHDGAVDAIIVEALGHSRKIVLEAPGDTALVPGAIDGKFALPPAGSHIDWLAEQLETDLDLSRTRLVPLLSNGHTVAVIACELNYPGDVEFFAERFAPAASMAGTVLGLALDRQRQQHLLERLVQAKATQGGARTPQAQAQPAAENTQPLLSLEALAEMAAGVAHELNNPLSVIAGRAQLLAEGETDKERKRALKQIQDNVRGASGVVDDLMSFAEPTPPRAAKTKVRQVIDEAVELAGQISKADHVNAQVDVDAAVEEVFVDSAQIVSALANVIANSIQSYEDTIGPVKISAVPDGEAIRLQVSDLGCGMDAEALRKATQPFFSARPAGRKRGMGLAYAIRLIELNGGTLRIESQPGGGTTVTVTLPG